MLLPTKPYRFYGALFACLLCLPASAHQLGVAWVSVFEEQVSTQSTEFQIQLKAPYNAAGRPPAIGIQLGEDCITTSHNSHAEEEGITRVWRQQCNGPLAGRRVEITGLNAQTPDAVLIAHYANGEQNHITLRRANPSTTLKQTASETKLTASRDYFPMGIEHILGGYDHLLLVFLFWLMARGKKLFWVVTSFTAAHSVSLALAVSGVISIPSLVIESSIALSIALLAAELLRQHRNKDYLSITLQAPALMALIFGLLHGLGFAGALAEAGLPSDHFWPALLLFNLGVEAGQLLFIAAVAVISRLLLAAINSSIAAQALPNLKPPMLYSIGGLSAFWFLQRLL